MAVAAGPVLTNLPPRRRGRWLLLTLGAGAIAYGLFAILARRAVFWAPPEGVVHRAPLFVRTLGDAGPPVVLLHGLMGSGRYWGAAFDALATDHRLVVPDLLGFGESPKPTCGYGPEHHAEALAATLDALRITEPVVLGAHSLGSLVALRFAARYPGRVRAVVAFGPPIYPSPAEARRGIARGSFLGGRFAFDSPSARRMCRWHQDYPGLSTLLVRLLRPELPGPVAVDTLKHTWESYWQTLEEVILPAQGGPWLRQAGVPVRLVVGSKDRIAVAAGPGLAKLLAGGAEVSVRRVEGGGHNLPLTHPSLCLDEIRRLASPGP